MSILDIRELNVREKEIIQMAQGHIHRKRPKPVLSKQILVCGL